MFFASELVVSAAVARTGDLLLVRLMLLLDNVVRLRVVMSGVLLQLLRERHWGLLEDEV